MTKRVKAGNCGALGQAGEDFLELGNDHDHQDEHDGGGDDEHGHGIEHGGDDLALDLLGLFHEFGQADEDDFEHAAQFAGLDHVDEEAVEDLGMLGQGLGEGAAAFDGEGQFADDVLEGGVLLLFFQHAQAAQQRQAGIHQRGQLAGEGGQDLGFDLAAQAGDLDLELRSPPCPSSCRRLCRRRAWPSCRPSPWPCPPRRSWWGRGPFP